MQKLENRLAFGDVAQALGCTAADVRAVVVEEKRLPAVYVTLVGAAQNHDYQLLKVDDDGLAFDLSVGACLLRSFARTVCPSASEGLPQNRAKTRRLTAAACRV